MNLSPFINSKQKFGVAGLVLLGVPLCSVARARVDAMMAQSLPSARRSRPFLVPARGRRNCLPICGQFQECRHL